MSCQAGASLAAFWCPGADRPRVGLQAELAPQVARAAVFSRDQIAMGIRCGNLAGPLGEPLFLQDHTADALPPVAQLDAAVRVLVAAHDHRHLITFVERWAEHAEPSREARLAQARAFLELRQMDRAWIRIKDIAEASDASRDALRIAAELFVRRGWPSQAREFLNRALANHPDDRELQRLWDRASEPPLEPDASARVLEDDNNLERLLPLAEDYLSTGQNIHARSVLERLRKHHPNHPRISDLLWAMDGVFTAGDTTLAQLTKRYAVLPRLPLSTDESEHTESISAAHRERVLRDLEASPTLPPRTSFPSLFRDEGDDITEDVTEEVTEAASMATREQMLQRLDPPRAAAFENGGDTRIRRVVMRDGPNHDDAPIHRGALATDPTFDLGEFRREMGMSSVDIRATIPSNFGHDLEDEDDDLVVLTRRERALRPIEIPDLLDDPTKSQVGREVAHLLKKPPTKANVAVSNNNIPVPDDVNPLPAPTPRPKPKPVAESSDEVTLEPIPRDPPAAKHYEWVEPRRGPSALTLVWLGVLLLVLLGGVLLMALLGLFLAFFPL